MTKSNEEFRQSLIKALYETHKRLGYSHEAIASKAGISRQTLGKIEAGKANPTMLMMFKITSAMNITLDEFVAEMKGKK